MQCSCLGALTSSPARPLHSCATRAPPRCECRIGTEHEKLGYNVADGRRLTYEQIAALLTRIGERFNWQPIVEEGHIIGLTQDGQSVTLEPGGQFELSGATVDTLHKTCAEVNNHLYQVRRYCLVGACCSAAHGGVDDPHRPATSLCHWLAAAGAVHQRGAGHCIPGGGL